MMRTRLSVSLASTTLALVVACNNDGSATTNGDESTGGSGDSGTSTVSASDTDSASATMTASASATDASSSTDPTVADSSGSSSTGGCMGDCQVDGDCLPGQSCIECLCIGEPNGCAQWGEGAYGDCVTDDNMVDNTACMSDAGQCLVDNTGTPTAGACFFTCTETCDCPQPPAGFEAQVTCSDLTGEGDNDCYIDCGGGGDCPDGMYCFAGTLCFWGEEPQGVGPYGDCVNPQAMCDGGVCIVDDTMNPTVGVCGENCTDATDCSAAPGGTAPPACIDLSGMGDNFCVLDCSGGEMCPDGMICVGNNLCIWEVMAPPPPEVPGYGDCANNPDETCAMGEQCVDDASGGVCSEPDCTMPSDCPEAPATGDAPVACGDIGLGAASCYLDCSAGQTCPDGMECVDDQHCHWASAGLLLDEDFEEGVFVPGWTLNDVDGHTPANQVAYVNAAWVVADQIEPGTNFAAYSTSYYTPAGQSDDWLISPQFTPSATSTLSWDGMAPDMMYADGYEVRVSTATTDPADFTANAALFSVDNEAQDFTNHMVDLSAYAGMPIYIAWRNVANDDFLLLIDNVQVTQ
ncbi:MAG: choice-of-anchor J domain-containing protein [Nannocystaceae bacterium]|nr:choice-of-anchor J domain-containing protein [Nannocystaceae bacterium]